jgi:hypothetical protein
MISSRNVSFLIVLLVFLGVLVTTASWYYLRYRRSRRSPYGSWEALLNGLSHVDRDKLALIAIDLVNESSERRSDEDPLDLDSSEVWEMIGGLHGLEVLERNCPVLVNLAFYLQQWYPEALLVAEQLRSNAREIQWHVDRLRSAAKMGRLELHFADYAPRAVATYYAMTQRVLALYAQCDLSRLAELQRVL